MDFTLTEDQQSVVTLAHDLFDGVTRRAKAQGEADGAPPADELWAQLSRTDLLAIPLPADAGGFAGGMVELAGLLTEAGRYAIGAPIWPTLVLGVLPIARFDGSHRWDELLRAVAAGEARLTAALPRRDASGPATPSISAVRSGDGWTLDGEAAAPAAEGATRILVPARTDDRGATAVFVVDLGAPGVTSVPRVTTSEQLDYELRLHEVVVSDQDVLGGQAADRDAVLPWLRARAIAGLCAYELGLVEAAIQMTAAYVSERIQFDRPIGSFQAVQHRLADAHIEATAMRWTMWQAAWRLDAEGEADDAVAVAKYWASRGGQRIMTATLHLHGGLGVDVTYPLHRYFLLSKQIELTLGTATESLAALGDALATA